MRLSGAACRLLEKAKLVETYTAPGVANQQVEQQAETREGLDNAKAVSALKRTRG